MIFSNWFGRAQRGGRRLAPVIDPLEGRTLLAATLGADGALVVTGTGANDQVIIRRASANGTDLHVQEGATKLFIFRFDTVRSISVDLAAGDDTLTVDVSPGLISSIAAAGLPITVNGGAGNDSLLVLGTAASGAMSEVLTVGPEAGGGTLSSVIGTAPAQKITFAALESVVDTAAAGSLTIAGNDGGNVVEVGAGPVTTGQVQTATVRVFDVTPCPVATSVPPATAALAPATNSREAKRQAKRQAQEAKRAAKAARLEARRLAREQKLSQKSAQRGAPSATTPAMSATGTGASATAAAAPAAAKETFVIDKTHVAIHFANKAAVTIDGKAGDDRIDLNLAAAPAGLKSVTIDAGAGADRCVQQAMPAGVAVDHAGVEKTATARDFELVTECPPVHVPEPIPTPPPPAPPPTTNPTGPTDGGGGGDDRDDEDDDNDKDKGKDKNDKKDKDKSRDDSRDESRDHSRDESRDHSLDADRGWDDDDD